MEGRMKRLLSAVLTTSVFVSFSNAEILKLEKVRIKEEIKESVPTEEELSQEDVEATSQIDLGKILSEIFPEVSHIRKGGILNDIVIRGFKRDDLNIIIDGAKIYGACPNRMDPPISNITSPQIEKIEIEEGAFDVSNQGSLAGAVIISTRNPKVGVGGEFSSTFGRFNYKNNYGILNFGNEKLRTIFGIHFQSSKPYKSGEGKLFTEYPTGSSAYQDSKKNSKAFDITSLWTKFIIDFEKDSSLKVYAGEEDSSVVLYPYLFMDSFLHNTKKLNAEYKIKNLKINFYTNKVKHDMRDSYRISAVPWTDGTKSTRGYMMRTLAESSVTGLKIQKRYRIEKGNIYIGLDSFKRNWKANNQLMMLDNSGMIPDVDVNDLGIFIKGVKRINKFVVSSGLRYDTTKSEVNKNAFGAANNNLYSEYYTNYPYSKKDYYLTGNILAKYKFNKISDVYIGFGHSVRTPDPQERYIALKKPMLKPDWVGNPNLNPVKNNEIDAGFNYKFRMVVVKGNIFYSDLNDYIYLIKINNLLNPSKKALSYQNIDAHIYGGDFSIFGALTENLSVQLGLSYQRGKKDSGVYTDDDLMEIPPLKTRLELKYENMNYSGMLETIYSAKQSNTDSDFNEQETKSYIVFNLKGNINFGNLSLNIGIDNIFDKNYYTYLSYLRNPFFTGTKVPEPGRFTYLNISYSF
jgi:iron complex outermembrane receptor protein